LHCFCSSQYNEKNYWLRENIFLLLVAIHSFTRASIFAKERLLAVTENTHGTIRFKTQLQNSAVNKYSRSRLQPWHYSK